VLGVAGAVCSGAWATGCVVGWLCVGVFGIAIPIAKRMTNAPPHHINTLPLLASLSHAGLMSPTIITINAMKDKNPKAALMVFSFLILLRPFEKARCASNTIDAATAMEVHSLRAAQFYCRIVPD